MEADFKGYYANKASDSQDDDQFQDEVDYGQEQMVVDALGDDIDVEEMGEGDDAEEMAEEEEDLQQQMSEEQLVAKILQLGNECLQNLGIAEPIEDVQVFTCDQFYIQFFEHAFPDFNFSEMAEAQTEEEMAENIQALIELLAEQILNYDLSHIKGDEIVNGNPEHIINLLQLAKEISLLMRQGGDSRQLASQSRDDADLEDQEQDDSGANLRAAQPDHSQDASELPGDVRAHMAGGGVQDNTRDDADTRALLQDMMMQNNQPGQEAMKVRGDSQHQNQQDSTSGQKRRGGIQEGDSKPHGEVSFDLEEEEEEENDDPQGQYSDFINKHDYGLQDDDQGESDNSGELIQGADEIQNEIRHQQRNKNHLHHKGAVVDVEGKESADPMQLANELDLDDEAMEGVDQEIAQIVQQNAGNPNVGQHQEGRVSGGMGNVHHQGSSSSSNQRLAAEIHQMRLQEGNRDTKGGFGDQEDDDEYEYDDDQQSSQNPKQMDQMQQNQMDGRQDSQDSNEDDEGEDDEEGPPIHPDLIAAAQEMGLALNSDQMRELQQFIEQQNNQSQDSQKNAAGQGFQGDNDVEGDEDEDDNESDQSDVRVGQQQHQQKKSSNQVLIQGDDDDDQMDNIDDEEEVDVDEIAVHMHDEDEESEQRRKVAEMLAAGDEGNGLDDDREQEYMDQLEGVNQLNHDDDQGGDLQDQSRQNDDEKDADDDDEEDEDNLLVNLNELNDSEKELLLNYLQEEYEKNPDQFPFPREQLEQIVAQNNFDQLREHLQLVQGGAAASVGQQPGGSGNIKASEMVVEDEDGDIQIEGGEQNVEDDNEDQLTQSQIQQMLLAQQQQQQLLQQQPKKKKSKKQSMVGGQANKAQPLKQKRKGGVNHSVTRQQMIAASGTSSDEKSQELTNIQAHVNFMAQQQQIAVSDEENQDPQQIHERLQMQNQQMYVPTSVKSIKNKAQRPGTAKGAKTTSTSYGKFIQQQAQLSQRGGNNNGGRSSARPSTAKPKPRNGSKGKKKQQQSTIAQQVVENQEMGIAPEIPLYSEEYLNQLSEDQLHELLVQQQAIMQQQLAAQQSSQGNQIMPQKSKRSRSAHKQMQRSTQKRSISAERSIQQTSTSNTRTNRAREIYQQPPVNFKSLGTQPHSARNQRRSLQARSSSLSKKQSKKPQAAQLKNHLKRKVPHHQGQAQSVMLNNFFPALTQQPNEGAGEGVMTQDEYVAMQAMQQQMQQQQLEGAMDAAGHQPNVVIDEAMPEEEEGESQEVTQSRKVNSMAMNPNAAAQQQLAGHQAQDPNQFHPQHDQMDEDMEDEYGAQVDEEGEEAVEILNDQEEPQIAGPHFMNQAEVGGDMSAPDASQPQHLGLTEEQLMELLQNADQLSEDQQAQLQLILKDRWNKELKTQKQKQYDNIYNILTENVSKAKARLASLAEPSPQKGNKAKRTDQETVARIFRQKQEYETLMRQHAQDQKARQRLKDDQRKKQERQAAREQKLAQIRERKFEEELINQQKSLMFKRNAQQVRLCQKVYKLASDLEKQKLLEEKKTFQEQQSTKNKQKQIIVDGIENFYKDKIGMLRERIETERFERKIAQQAQLEALNRMRREVTTQKKTELDKYLFLLKQEDQKYDMQSQNLGKLESEIVKLYRK